MKILVTNDDGIYAPGLWQLAKKLREVGTVLIVAPDREQSGVGTSVSLHHPLRINRVKSPIKDIEAYSVEGTPSDSVILAIKFLAKDEIDLVISGINEGPNIGNDIFISGTVGAALQGYFHEIPSLAISINAYKDLHFNAATKLASLLADKVKDGTLPRGIYLNVNLPNLPAEKIEGIEITKLAEQSYTGTIQQGHDGRREHYWIERSKPQWHVKTGTDIWALELNRISITPLPSNPDASINSTLKEVASTLFQELLTR